MFRNAADRSQVDNTLVNFDTFLQSVLINSFLQPLLALVAWISDKCQRTKPINLAEGGRGKKQKKRETCLVDNPQMDSDWKLRPGNK